MCLSQLLEVDRSFCLFGACSRVWVAEAAEAPGGCESGSWRGSGSERGRRRACDRRSGSESDRVGQ